MTLEIPKGMRPLQPVTVPAWQAKSSSLFAQLFCPSALYPKKCGQGLQNGRFTLLFQTNFKPQEADRPCLYVTDGNGRFAYMGQELETDSQTVEHASGISTTTFSIEGKPALSKTIIETMKVQTVYWKFMR